MFVLTDIRSTVLCISADIHIGISREIQLSVDKRTPPFTHDWQLATYRGLNALFYWNCPGLNAPQLLCLYDSEDVEYVQRV